MPLNAWATAGILEESNMVRRGRSPDLPFEIRHGRVGRPSVADGGDSTWFGPMPRRRNLDQMPNQEAPVECRLTHGRRGKLDVVRAYATKTKP
jgi:hypothetical protein